MENQRNNQRGRILASVIVTIAVIAVAVFVTVSLLRKEAEASPVTPTTQAGAEFIREKEAVPAASVEQRIQEEEQAKLDEARLSEMLSDPDSIFSAFRENNIVLVGESRTSGFTYYNWLDDSNFLGGVGWSVLEVPSLFDQIEDLQPSVLIFCFGINEMPREEGMAVEISSPEIYMETLQKDFDIIEKSVPDVKIYVNCIVPCTEVGYSEAPGFRAIPEWNKYIEKYCKEHGYGYIDISDICAEHEDMYISDGMHVVGEFYPLWGARILETIFRPDEDSK